MSTLAWQLRRNLENSLVEFLQQELVGVKLFHEGREFDIDIRVGHTPTDQWAMPNISVYIDTRTAIRAFIGNNKRFNTYLMIIDARAFDDRMRSDMAELITDTINDGFDMFTYTKNIADPQNPIKTLSGKVAVDFVTDNALRNAENNDQFEKYRHNISVSLTIAI